MQQVTLEEKGLTLKEAAQVLVKKGVITEAQKKELFIKGDAQRARIYKTQESELTAKGHQISQTFISPAEVIASFNLPIAGGKMKGKVLTEDLVTEAIAPEVGLEYMKIDPLKLNVEFVTSTIPRPFAQRHLIVPISEEKGVVTIAVADPSNMEAVENLARTKKLKTKIVLSSKTDVLKIVREFYGFHSSVLAAEKEAGMSVDLGNLEQYIQLKGTTDFDATDQHIVNAVEYILHYAYEQKASDVHIEPKREKTLVRLRIDGILHNIHTIPKVVHPSIVSRVKMLSRMDIAEKRKPQDGRIKTEYKKKHVELRISTLPTAFGEKIVMRIFDPDILFQKLEGLGFYKDDFDHFTSYLKRPYGIILVTGPTGSGKTTTLYSGLKDLASPEVNIVTIEDPIEMIMEEFNQVGVQPQIGLDFASALRTILRQDPDIIMVGEIRDEETAKHAVQAALTGHLVLTTLHTNDAPSSVSRLLDLGVPGFLISSTVLGVIAQRLVRKVCTFCKAERQLTTYETGYLGLKPGNYKVAYGEGCTECRSTGYKGRIGIFEIMNFSDEMKDLVSGASDLPAITRLARKEKMTNLRESAIRKMLDGETTYEEVVSVTG